MYAPGLEPFDIQVSSMELVQEIHQLLMDREDTCHRTCFSLQLDGNTLDNFAELKTIEGLKDGSIIRVCRICLETCGILGRGSCKWTRATLGLKLE